MPQPGSISLQAGPAPYKNSLRNATLIVRQGLPPPLQPLPHSPTRSLTTHQQVMHFISPKGGTVGCQLSLCMYQCRPNLQARGPSACIVSESAAGLFSGAGERRESAEPGQGVVARLRPRPQHPHRGGRRGHAGPGLGSPSFSPNWADVSGQGGGLGLGYGCWATAKPPPSGLATPIGAAQYPRFCACYTADLELRNP